MNTILPLHGKRGVDLLHDPLLNKGTAFNEAERDEFGLRGLLPPRVTTQEQQLERVLDNIRRKTDLLQGTLDMLILRVLSRGELHGWGITQKLEQLSKSALQVDEGSLYPSLYRMEEKGWIEAKWQITENHRRAKYYTLTRTGRKQLETELEEWDRMTAIIAQVMHPA